MNSDDLEACDDMVNSFEAQFGKTATALVTAVGFLVTAAGQREIPHKFEANYVDDINKSANLLLQHALRGCAGGDEAKATAAIKGAVLLLKNLLVRGGYACEVKKPCP